MYRPLLTEGVRVAMIMGAGDIIAQTFVEKQDIQNLDVVRTLKFASLGLVIVGPVLRTWYGVLDKAVAKNQPQFKRGLKKMALDQCLFAPAFTLALTTIIYAVNGESRERIKQRIRTDYPTIMLRNYMLWPAAQIINFSLVPINYQVVFAQIVAVFWNAYLSLVLNKK